MTAVLQVDPAGSETFEEAVEASAAALAAGGLVVVPTETVYGIAARPDAPGATARLFEAKRRPAELNLPILVDRPRAAWDVGEPTAEARALANAFWPGPLTMVLARADRSRPWDLGRETGTVAIRVPDHELMRALLDRTGPLAVTSANRSGSPRSGAPTSWSSPSVTGSRSTW